MPRKKCIQTIRDLVSCRSASLAKSCPGDVSTTFMRFPLFKKVFKVSTITIDLLLLLLPFAFWFAFKSQGLISILSVTICLLTIEITLKNASVVTGSAWVLEEKKYGTSRFSIRPGKMNPAHNGIRGPKPFNDYWRTSKSVAYILKMCVRSWGSTASPGKGTSNVAACLN